jgi:hypothetical protein
MQGPCSGNDGGRQAPSTLIAGLRKKRQTLLRHDLKMCGFCRLKTGSHAIAATWS